MITGITTPINDLAFWNLLLKGEMTLCFVSFALLFFRRAKSAPIENSESSFADNNQDLPALIGNVPELHALYQKLGYSATVDRLAQEYLDELKSLIQTNIIDFKAFDEALQDVSSLVAQANDENGDAPHVITFLKAQNLYNEVVAVENDPDQVLRILNRDPVYEHLPFIEQIPVYKDGLLTWRTPIKHTIIRKHPSDPERFNGLLDELDKLFSRSGQHKQNAVRIEVLESIRRLRRDLQRDRAYLPTSIQALEKKVAEYIAYAPSAAILARREQLNLLLQDVIALRLQYHASSRESQSLDSEEQTIYRGLIQKNVKKYIDARWMHTPWFTTYLLETMIDSEIDKLPKKNQKPTKTPDGLFMFLRNEVASGYYDCLETIRRLRQLENDGIFINSLIYGLLRVQNRMRNRMQKQESRR
jgi:hypothetical protein